MLDIAMLHFRGSGKRHTPIRVSALPILLGLFILCESFLAWAQAPPLEPLPVKSVTLFTSGVACMERGGTISGNAAVPLMFHTDQINDILKSMVLIDRGGKVQPATFASQDPIGKTLQSFAIDVSEDLSQVDLLSKLRGARVSVEGAGAPAVAGQVIGVDERQTGGTAEKPINAVFMNILTDAGLTAVRIEPGKTVRIEDERLDHDLREALKTLASGSDNQRRQVTLHFAGNGARQVRVAYVTEAPLWKMSYRLVLAANAKPYLQGWAIVENTTDEDWKGIRLSLVSGRPVSFIQDLYQPLYIPRPQVGPDVVASPNPQTHDENLLADKRPDGIPGNTRIPSRQTTITTGGRVGVSATVLNINGDTIILNAGSRDGIRTGQKLQVFRDVGNGARVPVGTLLVQRAYDTDSEAKVLSNTGGIRPEDIARPLSGPGQNDAFTGLLQLQGNVAPGSPNGDSIIALKNGQADDIAAALAAAFRSVPAQAAGSRAGEMFQYKIASLLDLPHKQAAMIPVVSQEIGADRVSIYNPQVNVTFPLNALRMRNTTALHLKAGPITLFDGGVYAGDARVEDVPPGDTRLISYAVDQDLLCSRESPGQQTLKKTVSIRRGLLIVSQSVSDEVVYALKSRTDKAKTVLVEHPIVPGYHLVSPASPTERAASLYRFAVAVPGRKTQTLKVVTVHPVSTRVAITDISSENLYSYSTNGSVPAKLKTELLEILSRRRHIAELKSKAEAVTEDVGTINEDQDRIRKNMNALDKSSALFKRYVGELDSQETRIHTLRDQAAELNKEAAHQENLLHAYTDGISE